MYIDSHAHLLSKDLIADSEGILERAKAALVDTILNISCRPDEWSDAILFCEKNTTENVHLFPTIGIHPDYYGQPEAGDFAEEIELMKTKMSDFLSKYPSIKAIGECGLDYYREFYRDAQIALFEMQIQIATKHGLPLVVHVREAFDDFFMLMGKYPKAKVILHCFTGNSEQAQRILSYPNTIISFSGIVTFDKTGISEASVKIVPLDRMLIETDSPYLAPVPKRGKTNEPSYVVHTAARIAEIKEVSVEEVARATSENAKKFLSLK